MIGAIEVRLSVTCQACDTSLPVNGPVPMLKCSRCLEVMRLEGRFSWPQLLLQTFQWSVRSEREPETRTETTKLRLAARLVWPNCPKCGKPHEPRPAKLALLKGKPIKCSCGDEQLLQPVPAHFAAAFPWVKGFVDADVFDETPGPPAAEGKGAPVVMACMSCRASLPVDGNHRLVECTYCKTSNYLPDDLWLSLHPVAKREAWFIVFDEDEVLTSIGR